MRPLLLLRFFLAVSLLLCFTACTSPTNLTGKEHSPSEAVTAEKVTLSEVNSFTASHGTDPVVFEDEASVRAFDEAVQTAERIKGILDVAAPHYLFTMHRTDGSESSYFLWLSPQSGMIMEVNDTSTGYRLTQSSLQNLIQIIEPDFSKSSSQ